MTWWSPKPLRPAFDNQLFPMVEAPTVMKSLSPEELTLYVREELVKSSLVAKYDQRPQQPKQDPEDPMTTVKSYIAFKSKEVEPDHEMAKSVANMNDAIAAFTAKTGAKTGS